MRERYEESGPSHPFDDHPFDESRRWGRRPVGAERFEADRLRVRNELRVQNSSSGARPASPGASDATQSPSRRERGETAYS
jgi:hypothetical protein